MCPWNTRTTDSIRFPMLRHLQNVIVRLSVSQTFWSERKRKEEKQNNQNVRIFSNNSRHLKPLITKYSIIRILNICIPNIDQFCFLGKIKKGKILVASLLVLNLG